MAGKLHLTYPPNIAKVKVMRRRTNVLGQGLWHIPFLFLYFFALRACVETSGNPYEVALAHHKSKVRPRRAGQGHRAGETRGGGRLGWRRGHR